MQRCIHLDAAIFRSSSRTSVICSQTSVLKSSKEKVSNLPIQNHYTAIVVIVEHTFLQLHELIIKGVDHGDNAKHARDTLACVV